MFCVHLIDVALCNVVKIHLQHSIQRKVRIPQRGQIHEYSCPVVGTARASSAGIYTLIYLIVLWFVVRRRSSSSFVVVRHTQNRRIVRHTQKILPIVHAAAGARACSSNGIWRICDFDFWHEKSICNHGIMCFENLYVLHNRLSGYLHEESRLLTFGDFSQKAAVALSLIEYGI